MIFQQIYEIYFDHIHHHTTPRIFLSIMSPSVKVSSKIFKDFCGKLSYQLWFQIISLGQWNDLVGKDASH